MAQTQNPTALKDTGATVAPEDVINEILPFCAQGQVGRDLLSQTDYSQDMQRSIGHQPGIARAALANKQARQVSHMAAGLAQFLARRYAPGVVDDGDLDKVETALVAALDAVINSPTNLATLLRAGLMQPDGVTVTVDEDGLLSALGGNLLLNSEEWITESGEWESPVTGWYHIITIGGGAGGYAYSKNGNVEVSAGASGAYRGGQVYLEKGTVIPVLIGAAGKGITNFNEYALIHSTDTSFGEYSFPGAVMQANAMIYNPTYIASMAEGGHGFGGADRWAGGPAFFYGGGGAAWYNGSAFSASDGAPGAVLARWHDPAKAAGPLPAPALLSARRMAPRAAAAPATVNLYDPETGQGSVWREEDAPAQLAKGKITEEAWLEICAQKAAEEYAAWLADPDTGAERFEMLRSARDAKLAATDYLVAPDYPLTADERAAVTAYRQALRDLPAQAGAPWDGGGEGTPWPEEPAVTKVQEA